MNKKPIHFIIILFLCLLTVLCPCSAALANEEPTIISDINVTKESEEALSNYLAVSLWSRLPDNTPNGGLIEKFAVAGDNKCAFALHNSDKIYMYDRDQCVACYHFYSYGEYRLFSNNGEFYIYDIRGKYFVCFDETNGATALYRITDESVRKDSSLLMWLGDYTGKTEYWNEGKYHLSYAVKSVTIEKGNYSLTNKKPAIAPLLTSRYDTLLWKDGVEEITLYSSSARHIQVVIFIVLFSVSTILGIAMIVFCIIAKKRNTTISRLWNAAEAVESR